MYPIISKMSAHASIILPAVQKSESDAGAM